MYQAVKACVFLRTAGCYVFFHNTRNTPIYFLFILVGSASTLCRNPLGLVCLLVLGRKQTSPSSSRPTTGQTKAIAARWLILGRSILCTRGLRTSPGHSFSTPMVRASCLGPHVHMLRTKVCCTLYGGTILIRKKLGVCFAPQNISNQSEKREGT